MADPILPYHYRVLAVFQHENQRPEDRFVNSWCFRALDPPLTDSAAAEAIINRLDQFYMKANSPGTTPINNYIPNVIEDLQYRVYNLGQTPPRTPMVYESLPAFTGSSGSMLPKEVALVLTLHSAERSRQGRGRLYLGPWITSATSNGEGTARPVTAVRNAVAGAAEAVRTMDDGMQWGVLSSISGFHPVIGGYVDNAWDTQRRRGMTATARDEWGNVQGGSAVIPRT